MRFIFVLSCLCASLLLPGCASLSSVPSPAESTNKAAYEQHLASVKDIQSFSLKGRLGVVARPNGFTGSLDWQHQPSRDVIDVYSPLGSKVASIEKDPAQVTLTDYKGTKVSAKDAESLTETTLGWRLPLDGLSDWALGRPSSSAIIASSWNAAGQLTTLKQDGWDIAYENYVAHGATFLPSRILLKNDQVSLKLLVEQWLDGSPSR